MPAFSPDGRWLAYMSTETALPEIYVRPFPRGEGQWKISSTMALHPIWSRTRPELLYIVPGSQNAIMAVRYASDGDSFRHERPRPWSPGVLLPVVNSRPYDLHPDGERIAMLKPPDASQRQESPVFVFNFLDELRRGVRAN